MKKMVVKIQKDGSLKQETFGYDGSECHKVANDVRNIMALKGLVMEEGEIIHKEDNQTNEEQQQMEVN